VRTLYARALAVLPPDVREQHGEEMCAVFHQLWADSWRQRGWRGAMRFAAHELIALLWFAWCVRVGTACPRRIDERMLMWSVDGRTLPMRESLLQDVKYALRLLRRTPSVAAACIATMALAIGANTAIFSLVHGVLLEPLPFPDSERLVVLGHYTDGGTSVTSTTPGNFYDWQARATSFESMAAFAYTQRVLARGDYAERVLGAVVTADAFSVLQRTAGEGRTLQPSDDDPGAPPVVVLSESLKARLFGERPAVGQPLDIGGVAATVAGVMPADFAFPDFDAQYWVPARFDAKFRQNRDQYFLLAIARLRAGTTIEQARAQLDTVMDTIRRDHPQYTQNATAAVQSAKAFLVQNVETRLWTLLLAVLFVLIIACANIANLLLARGASRQREMSLRHAIGARPQRLIRQMITESVVLAMAGGLVGVLLGKLLLDALVIWMADDLPRGGAVGMDATVLLITAGVTVFCGIAFGIWPALQLANGRGAEGMQHVARETGRSTPLRAALVVAEVALAFAVLVGAGLMTRSLTNLLDVRPGFDPTGLLTFNVSISEVVYRTAAERYAYFERAVEKLRGLPGVEDVALSTTVPVAGRGTGAWFNILDRPLPADQTPPAVPYRVVSPNYFTTLRIPLRAGRLFADDDGLAGKRVVIVSEAVARRFWPDGGAIGQRIYLGAPNNRIFQDAAIVGVVGDVKQAGLDEAQSEAVYIPLRLTPSSRTFAFVVRTEVPPSSLTGSARARLREIDPGVPIHGVQTMEDGVRRALAPARSSVYLLSTFAVVALMLAVIGVFAVLSYSVAQRRTEVAIRLALGAETRSIMRLMFRQGIRQVVFGVVLGVVLAIPLGRYIEGLLFGVRPADPATFALVAGLLLVAAGAAVYVPARRATKVDPVEALRA
jgi:putative ABC transport system permease protein